MPPGMSLPPPDPSPFRSGPHRHHLFEEEGGSGEGKRPPIAIVEILLRAAGPVHDLVVDAGNVENQAHHQGEAWGAEGALGILAEGPSLQPQPLPHLTSIPSPFLPAQS